MLTTKQNVLRRFWYAVIAIDDLKDGPKPFRLLGEDIVLFLDENGKPAALKDRCCHRTAKLSKGWMNDGQIVCGYHGWTYDRTGKLTHVPQFPVQQEVPNLSTPAYHCEARYGYAWVALDEPLAPILDAAKKHDPAFRRIPQFYEVWNTSAFRLMENSFDNAHFAFVHKGTFGQLNQPLPEKYEIKETDYGFEAETLITVANPPVQHRIAGTTRADHQAPHAQQVVHAVLPQARHRISVGAAPHHLQFGNADRRRPDHGGAVALPERHRSRLLGPGADRLGLQDHPRGQGHHRIRPTTTCRWTWAAASRRTWCRTGPA